MSRGTPDIGALNGIVSDQVIKAMQAAHEVLERAGIPHALVGALAVGAYGYPRASKDVDFLVGDEAFDYHGSGIVTLKAGIPIEYKGIVIDPISISPGSEHLRAGLEASLVSDGIPVLPPEALVYMKLMSPRRKDAADVVELVAAGLDVKSVMKYLSSNAAYLKDKFSELVSEAEKS